MNELVKFEEIPKVLILDTAQEVEKFYHDLKPYSINDYDVREVLNEIADTIVMENKERTFQQFRKLPEFDRIVSKHFLETIERQHLLKAATFELATGVYHKLEVVGAFRSQAFKGKFPYVFDRMVGKDAQFYHMPY